MPVTKSAEKKRRRDKKRTLINKRAIREMKAAVKKMREKPSQKAWQKASSLLDMAAKKKLIHKNRASRLKARLTKLLPKAKQKKAKK